ncbi:MAG: hypothetical protein Q9191_002493 [Dirinaria sp. TL-2023a]
MAPSEISYGRRLLPSLIDEIAAQSPDRPWVSLPETQVMEDGFRDLSYRCLANSINRMAWWLEKAVGKSEDHETVAYLGPPDVRYYVVCIVAAKVGYKAFFPSPRNSLDGHVTLLQNTRCCKFLVAPGTDIEGITSRLDMQVLEIPSLEDCFKDTEVDQYPFTETWEKASKDPIAVLHTSGSTGIPKPIVITHEHMAAVDKYHFLPPAAGLIGHGLASGVFLNTTFVFGPSEQPPDAGKLEAMIKHGNASGCVVPPSVLEDAYKFVPALERISSLDFVLFGGGTLDNKAGDAIATKSRLVDVVGSTEVGALPEVLPAKDEDWKIHRFHPRIGCRFRHHLDDLYEMVITRDDPQAPWNGLPSTFSEEGEYPMRDLYSRPLGVEDGWIYRGRVDDVIVLSNGEKINPIDMERQVSTCPDVKSAIVVGSGKFQPAILIELLDDSELWQESHLERLDSVWRYIEEANTRAPSHGRLMKEYVLFATREKPFSRLPKGTIQRQMSTKQYEEEINKLYESMESEDSTDFDISVQWEDRKSMEQAIYCLIEKTAPQKSIGREDLLFNNGFDSMHVVKLSRSLRSALSTAKSDVQQPELQRLIYANPTPSRLADALWSMLHHTNDSKDTGAQNQQVHDAEVSLSNLIHALPRLDSETPVTTPDKTCIVLTGSTGSLGSYILHTLLKTKSVNSVICLNRSPDAVEKQRASFSSRGLSTPLHHVKFLQADFSQPNLGLRTQDHDHLLQNATHIIHNAWQVDFNLPFTYYSQSHLQGVLELIKLSAKSRYSAKILFASSISTVSRWDTSLKGPVPETPIRDFSTAATMGYALSKLVSEILLSEASSMCHIRATVCRIGQIAGPVHLKDGGKWNASEWVPSLLSTSQELGTLPETLGSMERIDWVPIDIKYTTSSTRDQQHGQLSSLQSRRS